MDFRLPFFCLLFVVLSARVYLSMLLVLEHFLCMLCPFLLDNITFLIIGRFLEGWIGACL